MNQIELHKKIDALLARGPTGIDQREVSDLVSANKDTHQYFYAKADERWLDWLRDNEFLDVVKEKAEDPTRYGYRTPELNYLVRMTEKVPAKVVGIILDVKVSKETFNPEVVDRFSWICSILPAKELARVVPKIRNENWIPLMGPFNRWGFEYEKMFKTLVDAKDYKSILVLAEAILAVHSKEEVGKDGFAGISTENPFYFNDLSYTKVFEHLANISDEDVEQTLVLATKVMDRIVLLGGRAEDGAVFPVEETFHLYDVDFFSLEPGKKKHLSYRDDVRELAAVIKALAQRLIGDRCNEPDDIRRIYQKHIQSLPHSRAMWRLRLFALSLCPEIFKDELKTAFFRLFDESGRYHEFISGTEYEKALQRGFPVLSEPDKREYVSKVLEYFSKQAEDKEDQKWHKTYGSKILSMITNQLTEEEKRSAEEAGFKLDPQYEPEPSISPMFAGAVVPRGPITLEQFGKLPIADIAEKLRAEWAPEKLRNQNTSDDDFFNPLNAEGVGGLLRADIANRLQDYAENAGSFFERNVLDQHYTYSFLRGVQEILREKKVDTSNINWDGLIKMCTAIATSGESTPFEPEVRRREVFDAWLSGWNGVHSATADVIQELITEINGKTVIDFPKYREALLATIRYLLTYPDPAPEDEEVETAKVKVKSPGSEEPLVGDPFTTAINTVRGRAFQALTLFVYQDGKRFKKEDKSKLSPEVKELYETVLKNEKTRALMFMFGHYLPTFYFRDRDWIRGLLPQIFPTAPEKKHLHLAAWEGYLANNLFEEMFFDSNIQELYKRGVELKTSEMDAKRKYFKDPDESIATHFALAFTHYEGFGFDHPLFKAFWKDDSERHANFISFIGRSLVSGDSARADRLFKEKPWSKKRLEDFWDWMLDNYTDPRPLAEFGYWVSTEKEIFDVPWLAEHLRRALKETRGSLEWDYGLTRSIINLAEAAPEDTLEIARFYWLEGGVRGSEERRPWHIENEWFEVFQILYKNPLTKEDTYALIDDLIREGGSAFWKLKEILNENK